MCTFWTLFSHVCEPNLSWKVVENAFCESWKTLEFGLCKFWKVLENSILLSVRTLFREPFSRCLCRQWILMFQATWAVSRPSRLEGRGHELGGRPATGLATGTRRASGGRAGLLGSCVAWHKRNKAGIRLGAQPNTVQGSLLTTHHTHTHRHTQGCAMGLTKWPWHCG